jgi:proline iminopeptidase
MTRASWGATLALAYAQEHPERVTEMSIPAVTMTRPSEIYWLYEGAGRLYPRPGTGSGTGSPSTSGTVTCWRRTRG